MSNSATADVPVITLGWRLRISMERAGIKRDQMAVRMGVNTATITRWTHDVGSPPRSIYIEKWSEITGVSMDWLTGDTGQASGRETIRYAEPIAA